MFMLSFAAGNAPLWAASDGLQRSQRLFGVTCFAQAPRTAEAIDAHTPENSRILVWGSEAEIYFLSRRLPASRFLFHYPFTAEAPPLPGGGADLFRAIPAPSPPPPPPTPPLPPPHPCHRHTQITPLT